MTRLLAWLGGAIPRHPWRFVLVTVLPCLLLGGVAATTPMDFGFASILDLNDPTVAQFADVNTRLNLGGRALLVVDGEESPVLDEAAEALTAGLAADPTIKWATTGLPTDWLDRQGPWAVGRPVFDDWLALATDPADLDAARRLADARDELEVDSLVLTIPEGMRLVVVQMLNDPPCGSASGSWIGSRGGPSPTPG